MKTSSGLALAATLVAAAGAVYTGLPAAALQPPPDARPSLPPVVLDPGVRLPPPAPADMVKPPTMPPLPAPPKAELPPVPPVTPAPLPVPQPIVPAAKAEPTKLPAVPPPPVVPLPPLAPPAASKLPAVPPPVAQPLPAPPVTPLPPPAPLPKVPPPDVPAPKATPLPPPLTVTPTTTPSAGSVVVLQDGKIVEGHVSRTEDKVIVRRATIEQPFPSEQVKYVAASKDEAYRLALNDTKLDDPAARLRLARWCMYNGMRESALTEAKEAVRLEPANRTAAALVRTLEESLRLYPGDGTTRVSTPAPTPPAPALPGLPAVPPPGIVGENGTTVVPGLPPHLQPAATPPVTTVREPDVAPEAVVAFGPRVQPVLMNQCASCHAKTDHAGSFKLTPVATNEVNAGATRANLTATAAQVKKADPATSPLLVKATTAHGGQTAPAFTDRESAAYRVLHAWVYLSQGELAPPVVTPPAVAPPVVQPVPLPPPPYTDARPTLPPALPLPPPPTIPAPPPIPPADGSIPPIPPANDNPGFGRTAPPPIPVVPAKDEFDPDNFNRPVPPRR